MTISAKSYERACLIALGALTLIVMTGAAVRLTGSGLGCPDWPRCYGKAYPPLDTHALIEFSNRVISGLVGIAAIGAALLAWRRRPFRRDLALLSLLLPFGVVAQAVLGGFTVRHELAPGYVMAHFGLSMLILVAATALTWRARFEPGSRRPSADRALVWGTRALVPLAAVVIFAGTVATAAGPHAGGKPGQVIHRLHFRGAGTLNFSIHSHGALAFALGVGALALFLRVRGGEQRSGEHARALTALCIALAAQGVVGSLQYATHLPAEIVWVHVVLASLTWVCVLWAAAGAGSLEHHSAVPRERTPAAESRSLQAAAPSRGG
ncbi:MAG: COX15/CtaA family protein [Solirubrobacteraceae bacterium]